MFKVETVKDVERFYSALGTNGRVSSHHDTGKGVIPFSNEEVQSVQKMGEENTYWIVTLRD